MKISKIAFTFFSLIALNSQMFCQTITNEFGQNYISKSEWGTFFAEHKIEGTFVLYNLHKDSLVLFNHERASKQFLPASTFKIINSLVSLETKVVEDENAIIKWDGVKRFLDNWNQDQSMKTAFPISCVWFYQELARRVGIEKMEHYLNESNYGNKKLGDRIDSFWLEGDLRISPIEQIQFLSKFINSELPFDEINIQKVKNIMRVDSTSNYNYYAKTGWAVRAEKQVGWYVGYVESEKDIWIFAINIEIKKDEDAKWRKIIAEEILRNEGIIN